MYGIDYLLIVYMLPVLMNIFKNRIDQYLVWVGYK